MAFGLLQDKLEYSYSNLARGLFIMAYYNHNRKSLGVIGVVTPVPREEMLDITSYQVSNFTLEQVFRNNTNSTIHIGTRDGVKYTVRPIGFVGVPKNLYCFKSIQANCMFTDIILPDDDTEEGVGIRKAYEVAMQNRATSLNPAMTLQYIVLEDALRAHRTIYISPLDITVSTEPPDRWEHRYSAKGTNQLNVDAVNEVHIENPASLSAFIVCDNERMGNRYINLNGTVIKLPIVQRRGQLEGLYVYYPTEVDPRSGELSDKGFSFYPLKLLLENALALDPKTGKPKETELPFNIYLNVNDASTLGNPLYLQMEKQRQMEQERNAFEQQALKNKVELENVKHQSEMQKQKDAQTLAELQKEIAELKHRNEVFEAQAKYEFTVEKSNQDSRRAQYDFEADMRKQNFDARKAELELEEIERKHRMEERKNRMEEEAHRRKMEFEAEMHRNRMNMEERKYEDDRRKWWYSAIGLLLTIGAGIMAYLNKK